MRPCATKALCCSRFLASEVHDVAYSQKGAGQCACLVRQLIDGDARLYPQLSRIRRAWSDGQLRALVCWRLHRQSHDLALPGHWIRWFARAGRKNLPAAMWDQSVRMEFARYDTGPYCSILMLAMSNVFMTFAGTGILKFPGAPP